VNRDGQDRRYNLLVRTAVILNITTVGRPFPELTLFKKDSTGAFVEHHSTRFSVTLIGLRISSVEPEDAGEYRLNAFSEGERDDEEFQISVTSKYMSLVIVYNSASMALVVMNN